MISHAQTALSPIVGLSRRLANFAWLTLALAIAPALVAQTRTDSLVFTQYTTRNANGGLISDYLPVGGFWGPSYSSALQYNLSSLAGRSVKSAKLKLKTKFGLNSGVTLNFTLAGSTTDTWIVIPDPYYAGTLYQLPPATGTLGTYTFNDHYPVTSQVLEFDVTSFVQAQMGASDQKASFVMSGTSTSNVYEVDFYRDATTPTLEVESTTLAFAGTTTNLALAQNSAATDVTGLLHVSESLASQTVTWTQAIAPAHGTLVVSGATAASTATVPAELTAPSGTFTYQPTTGYTGEDTFSVLANDGVASDTRKITVLIGSTVPLTTPTMSNLGAGQVTLNLQSGATGTGYFTLLEGSGNAVSVGSVAQTIAGLNGTGTAAASFGSLTLTANTPSAYTVRNLKANTTYTVCFTATEPSATLQPVVTTTTFTTTTVATVATPKWKLVGNANFSAGQANYPSLAFAPNGTPYLAFVDVDASNNATVMKYDGAAWVAVGTSPGACDFTSLAFAPDGTPYLAYKDFANSYRATVRKFDGTAWVTVGDTGLSAGSVGYTSLAFAPDGTPYLAYEDIANSYKATVMKFNGTAWVVVGSAGLSAGSTYNLNLVIAPDGTPYLSYQDYANSSKATVMKFDGTAWVAVGAAGLSAGTASFPSLVLAPDGTPYLAYQDYANSSKATVMKFDGTAWATVGTAGFTDSEVGHTCLALTPDGTLYLSYADTSYSNNKPVVMKYNGTAWVYVGNNGVANSDTSATNLAIAPDGTPYVAYTDSHSPNNNKVSVRAMAEATVITSVDLPAAGYYKLGAKLDFTVHFNHPVTLTTTGDVSLAMLFQDYTSTAASCFSGTNTTSLTFIYTVPAGHNGTLTSQGIVWLSTGGGGTMAFVDSDGDELYPYPTLPTLDLSGIILDTNAPQEPNNITLTATAVSGYGEAGSTIKVYDSGTYLGTATVGSNSQWSLAVTLTDGSHSVTAIASDAAGNTTTTGSATVQTVDATPPTITSALTATGAYNTSFSYTITATDTNGLRTYLDPFGADSLPTGLSLSEYSGVISGTPTQIGTFPITLTAYDTSGNKGTATLTLTINKATQTINFSSLYEEVYDPNSTTTINLSSSTASNLPITYKVTGPATLGYNSTSGQNYLTLTGTGTVTVTASQAGNEYYLPAPDVVQTFTVKPLATITLSNASLIVAYDGKPHGITATTTPAGLAVTIEYYNIGSKAMTASTPDGTVTAEEASSSTTPPTAVGNYAANAWVDDGTYLGETYGLVTILPATPTTPATTTNNTTPVLSGIADPNSMVGVFDGTTLLGSVTASAAATGATTGNWTFTPTTALAEGTHSITIKEVTGKTVVEKPLSLSTAPVAESGDIAIPTLVSAALVITIDTTTPNAPVITTASGLASSASPTLTGTSEANATVTLFDGSATLGTTIATNTGAWTYTPTTALSVATHTITAKTTDTAGNVGPASPACTLIVGTAPAIATQPAAKTVIAGSAANFTVSATGTETLSYTWQRSVDGTTYTDVASGTSTSYSLTSATVANSGNYRVIVSNAFGTATSNAALLTVTPNYTAAKPDGYASATTGGAAGTSVVVLTAADFKTQATSTTASVITVVGQLSIGTVNVASNKTIQGADANAALVGNLNLSNVTNVIIRGLHLTNPGTTIVSGAYTDGGDALTITGSSKVFVTHCTFFNCADHDIKIVTGSDNVTVSWCEFYASSATLLHRYGMQIGAASDTLVQHVTLHHNWWTTSLDQRMPFSSYGYVHQYNNYVNATGNTASTVASDHTQLFSERNVYANVASPLTKATVSVSTFVAGQIRTIGNLYTTCTGTAADAGTDTVFTPAYSYELLPASDVATEIAALAGNTAGAGATDATTGTATITGPTAAVPKSSAFTLTATPTGFTAASYQWRLNNVDVAGATTATYTVASAQTANAGTYTAAISMASGDTVVSAPQVVTLGEDNNVQKIKISPNGGGAPSLWYLSILALLGTRRFLRRKHT